MNSGERTKLRCGKYRESEADSVQVVLGNRRFVPFLFSPRFGSGSICKPHFLEVPDPLVSFGIIAVCLPESRLMVPTASSSKPRDA